MILFLASFPEDEECQDGFGQRILVIDNHFENEDRTYIGLSARRYWVPSIRKHGKCKIVRTQWIIGLPLVLFEAIRCKIIYIHSIYNVIWAFYLIPWCPFIIDIHGVVPEELFLSGHPYLAKIYGWIESLCMKFALAKICVTRQMENHLADKYPFYKAQTIILPIMQSNTGVQITNNDRRSKEGLLRVVYSGGIQPWQNIDLMVETMAHIRGSFEYEIYTPAVEVVRAHLNLAGVRCRVESLDRGTLCERYRHAAFGFLLRDPVLVNRVACPTKLIEYMQYGIIPIVLQPVIGDMDEFGYAYVLLTDFCNGKMPSEAKMETMRQKNWAIIKDWEKNFDLGVNKINKIIGLGIR